jgi:hypothetical protein
VTQSDQGCQMVYFLTKIPNLGRFWRVSQRKMLVYNMAMVYFTDNWYIIWSFGVFYGHLEYFMAIWYVAP